MNHIKIKETICLLVCLLILPELTMAVDYDGLLEPYRTVKLSSAVAGVLDQMMVERGDHIDQGDVIATLKSGVEQANVQLAEVRYKYAMRKVRRNKSLIEKGLISESDRDKLQQDAEIAAAKLNVARKKLALLTIYSPISGVVMERFHSAGEFVRNDEIVKLAQTDPLNIEVIVPASNLKTLKQNMPIEVSIGEPLNKTLMAHVVIIDPVVDLASNTIGVRLNLANHDFSIPAGLKCKVHFPDK